MSDDERCAVGFQFRKQERIRTRNDISRVFKEGNRWSTKGMRLNVLRNGGAETRAVFVTVRGYGNAVVRNRARRVVSECWRLLKATIARGLDVVILIYPDQDSMTVRQSQLQSLVQRAKVVV